jgi:hypothetical protein
MITLSQPPGFVDLPDSVLAPEGFALGLHFQRILGNAKFGLVRPEFFQGTYNHGQTVALPVSPVDGYAYERDELVYLWSYLWTGAATQDRLVSGKGSIWYFGVNVDQTTGVVSSYIKYRQSDNSYFSMTNDGWVQVVTIGVRRKTSMIATGAAWTEIADSTFAQDAPMTGPLATAMNQAAKAAALSFESIYMGEFVHGQQIPQPVSPVDGHTYAYTDVQFAYSWRWTTEPNAFQDPTWVSTGLFHVGLNQLHRIAASIDATGNVTLNVVHYDSGEQPTNNGRITVVALCQRKPTLSALAPTFADLSEDLLSAGDAARYDVLRLISDTIKAAAVRPEVFIGTYLNGQTVPVPTSTIDGYTYDRSELFYVTEWATTAPETDIRIQSFSVNVDPLTGLVKSVVYRLHDGGRFVTTTDGTTRVWTIAMRGHQALAIDDPTLTGSGTADPEGELVNGGFDVWSNPLATVADGWRTTQLAGAGATSHETGLDGSNSAQGLYSDPAGQICVASSKLSIKAGERRALAWKLAGTVATTTGLAVRIDIWNALRTVMAQFYLYNGTAVALGPTQYSEWIQMPRNGESVALTSRGNQIIYNDTSTGPYNGTGVLDFDPAWAQIHFFNSAPNVSSKFTLDAVQWIGQADAANGQVGSRGSLGLAFFPAIPISVTDTTASLDLSAPLNRNDGSTTPTGLGTVTITGLTAATQYAVELYYDEIARIVKATGAGTGHGSNGWCFLPSELTRTLAIEWGDVAHLPLSEAPIYFTTNASPTDPPTGTFGGGDGGCHREDVKVREHNRGIIFAHDARPGDLLWDGDDRWTEVEVTDLREQEDWIHLDFSNGVHDLPVTSGHTFENAAGELLRAYEVNLETELAHPGGRTSPLAITRRNYRARKAVVRCKAPHTFMVSMDGVNWVRSHNNNRLISTQ